MNKQDLRIVFLGTPEFAVESLRAIVDNGFNVVAAVTMPDKPAGRGHKMYQSPVKAFALSHNIPLLQPISLKDPEFVADLRAFRADLFVVIAFRMLPEVVWSMPPLGTFNLHASLLPQYRGAAPINHAVINGEPQTGVTTFFLKHEIDTGDIIDRRAITIAPDENVGSVHDRLMRLGAQLTLETLDNIIRGTVKTTPQAQLAEGETLRPAPKITPETCHICWNRPAAEIYNLIRGLSPYPAANAFLRDGNESPERRIKIFEAELTSDAVGNALSGTLSASPDRDAILVACNDLMLRLTSLQIDGKRRMSAADFLRGFNVDGKKFV